MVFNLIAVEVLKIKKIIPMYKRLNLVPPCPSFFFSINVSDPYSVAFCIVFRILIQVLKKAIQQILTQQKSPIGQMVLI